MVERALLLLVITVPVIGLDGLAYDAASFSWLVVVVVAVSSFEVNLAEAVSFGFSDVVRWPAVEDVFPGLTIVAALALVKMAEKAESSFSGKIVVIEEDEVVWTAGLVLREDIVTSLVRVVAPLRVLQEVVIVLVTSVFSVVVAEDMAGLLFVLQEVVRVLVTSLFSVVVTVETVKSMFVPVECGALE